MQLNRRHFLQLSGAVIASAAVGIKVAEAAQPNKYEVALRMLDDAASTRNYPVIMNPRFDAALGFVLQNWDAPVKGDPDTRRETKRILAFGTETLQPDEIRRTPATILESAWPIAYVKHAFRDLNLPVNHRLLTNFKAFHERYGSFILED